MTTLDSEKQSVRGFRILIKSPVRKTLLCLPCQGFSLYTGRQALKLMESYKWKRDLETIAETEDELIGTEHLTLDEMRELYAGE